MQALFIFGVDMGKFENIGALVRESRIKKGYSQGRLGHLLGYFCDGQFISNIERGKCSLPLKKIAKAAYLLDIDVDDIYTAMEKDFSNSLRGKNEKISE